MMETNILYDVVGFQCLDQIDHQTNDLYLTRCGFKNAVQITAGVPSCVLSTICILSWMGTAISRLIIISIISGKGRSF